MLGNKLRITRKIKGYSLRVISEKIKLSQQTLSEFERNLKKPSEEYLNKLIEIMEVIEKRKIELSIGRKIIICCGCGKNIDITFRLLLSNNN